MASGTVSCTCGKVVFETTGDPITTVICCCDDCQKAGRRLEALPGAAPVLDAHGGTAVTLWPKDRITCVAGDDLLESFKLYDKSITNRAYATCCNAAMMIRFDRGPHWNSVFRDRIDGKRPPAEVRIQTRFVENVPEDGIPSYRRFPASLIARIAWSMVPMFARRLTR
ncbi:MAG: hypothetical protein CL534_15775 [Ahrensia sp.]|nr:hypothetical protein [Ahrensia sp.]